MKIYIIAGEPSGDLHGKNLIREMQQIHPDIELRGVGGDGLEALGVRLTRHIRETSFMGFVEVVKNLGKIRQLFKDVKADIEDFKPDAVILIDYPGFNLRMAKWLQERGIRSLFYISPQVWAWKKSRVKKIQKFVDRMYVILPFEKEFYAKEGVEVDFVGHPLLDEIGEGDFDGEALRQQLKIKEGKKVVALLPGSRQMEIKRMLPRMLAIVSRFPDCEFVIAGAPGQEEAFYKGLIGDQPIKWVSGNTYGLLSVSDYALVTSGTATLETALFGVPEVVCYAGGWLSVQLARWLIRVKYISLVNLVMDREVVTELIQKELNSTNLEKELRKLMNPEHRGKLESDYQELTEKLGNQGASERAAKLMLSRIKS